MSRAVCPWCLNPYVENEDGVLVCKNVDCKACAEEYLHAEIEKLRKDVAFANGELDYIKEQVEKDSTMREHNDYGMYSGGYLFDLMDRAALFYIREFSGLPDDAVLVTKRVHEVEFKRQVCNKYNVTVRCDRYHEIKLYSVLYSCYVEVLDNKGNVCASASFTFTEATNHCAVGDSNE